MAIQMRRGLMRDFDPYKMLPGEWAVSIDASTSNQIVWMCFEPGVCKRMGTYEDFVEQVKEATEEVKTEYSEEFNTILNEVKTLSIQVSSDKNTVVSIKTDIQNTYLPQIQKALSDAQLKAESAKNSADAAAISEANAKTSEKNAKSSETAAKNSQTNAAASESNAKTSAANAATSASTATTKATAAANYASNAETSALTATNKATEASTYANNAKKSENTANTHATTASNKASEASTSANTASVKANDASDSALLAESYTHGGTGVRDNEDVDNAQYYKNQAERISQGLSGALLPMGTITFSQLANQTKQAGYMYNISNSFTTNNTFKEGAGYPYPEGTNVYYTADGYWDCIAGTSVVGVKGSAESSYRKGSVNITKSNIGLSNVDNTSDADKPISDATQAALGEVNERIDDVDTRLQKIDDSILNTLEEIDANTSGENIAGALAIKSLKSNFDSLANSNGVYLGTTGSLTLGMDENIVIPNLTDYKFLLFVFNGIYVADFVSLFELNFNAIDKFSRKTIQEGYYFNLRAEIVEAGINIKLEEIAGYSYANIAIYGLR